MEKAGRIQVLQSRSAFGPRHYENNKLCVAEKPNAEHEVFDYNNVNYQDFWQQTDRRYEDAAERIALRRLTKTMQGSCLEIGCGFGRLVDEYAPRCSQVLLTDCTAHLIEAARQRVDSLGLTNVECRQLDLYKLEECGRRFDNAICVRVMHHVEDVPAFSGRLTGPWRRADSLCLNMPTSEICWRLAVGCCAGQMCSLLVINPAGGAAACSTTLTRLILKRNCARPVLSRRRFWRFQCSAARL